MNDEIVKHTHKSRDRVTVGFTRKINVAKYESLDIHAGYSADKEPDETADECFDRVSQKTLTHFKRLLKLVGDGDAVTKKGR